MRCTWMIFICYICGSNTPYAQMFEDLIGNKIYVCDKCVGSRMHRVKYKYRYLSKEVK